MPQVFQVLKCYKCLVFQVHQTKKSNKFQCKVCGEKQSIKRHYGLGNGLECRKHVQKLNTIQGVVKETKNDSDDCSEDENMAVVKTKQVVSCITETGSNSKWSNFIDPAENIDKENPSNDAMYLNDTEVVLELPKKRFKTLGRYTKNGKDTKTHLKNTIPDELNNDNEVESLTRITTDINSQESSICNNYNKKIITNLNLGKRRFEYCNESSGVIQENSISNFYHQPNNVVYKTQSTCIKNSMDESSISSYSGQNLVSKENKAVFIDPAINKNSKWATFAEEIEDNDLEPPLVDETYPNSENQKEIFGSHLNEHDNINIECLSKINTNDNNHTMKNKLSMLFSLSDDDNAIDDYLAI